MSKVEIVDQENSIDKWVSTHLTILTIYVKYTMEAEPEF